MSTIVKWLQTYWFLITTLFACGVAWGQTQNKMMSLEEAIKETVVIQTKVEDLQKQNAKLEERTIQIQESQRETQELLRDIYMQNKSNQRKK